MKKGIWLISLVVVLVISMVASGCSAPPPVTTLTPEGTAVINTDFSTVKAAETAPKAVEKAKRITTPKEFFGHELGEDYFLANNTQISAYWEKLGQESNRIKVVQFGVSSYGRPMEMAIVTSPSNLARLDHYKEISKRLALAEGLTDDEARALAAEGKPVVWIDAGMHGSEVAVAQALAQMVYRMASENDDETLRILDDVIFLAVLSNPDGLELCPNWYMNDHATGLPQEDPLKRSSSGLPIQYQKYIGHDNNREYYTIYMPEEQAIARVLFSEWFPQIVYNQHQSGPRGTVLYVGAMRDPLNYNLDSLQFSLMENLSSAVHKRFIDEGKRGATCRSGASYALWYCGGLRTSASFHNQVGILSEITGTPTPSAGRIAYTRERGNEEYWQKFVPTNDYPFPIPPPKEWHLAQAVDYLISADLAHLDYASRNSDKVLFAIYRMGKNSIERGSQDNWTWNPRNIANFLKAVPDYQDRTYEELVSMTQKDARGYIIPSDQTDFLTSIKFVNSLLRANVQVLRATQDFEVEGKTYPSGSFIVKTAQAFRPCVMDAFEPLWYPDDIECPGMAPTAPYDMAGYTLAFQMGIKFDSIYEDFNGPFEKVTLEEWTGAAWADEVKPPAGIPISEEAAGYLLSHEVNDSFIAVNRLMANGEEVYWLKNELQIDGKTYPAGTMYIPSTPSVLPLLQELAGEKGLNFEATASTPTGDAFLLTEPRVGLVDKYGSSKSEGWTEWMLDQFEFPVQVVYPQELDAGNLNANYDVLIFEHGYIPKWDSGPPPVPDPLDYPPEYRDRLGSISAQITVPELINFLEAGGTILTIGSSAIRLGDYDDLDLPISNYLVDEDGDPLPKEVYYVPGSVLEVRVDNSLPIACGMPENVNVYFSNSPVWEITEPGDDISAIAWFDSSSPLRSGFGWGQAALEDGVTGIQAQVGDGTLFMFGPTINFRGQSHGTFKFFFNGIYSSIMGAPVTLQ